MNSKTVGYAKDENGDDNLEDKVSSAINLIMNWIHINQRRINDSFIGKDKILRIDKWKSEISELKESIREINNENASSAYKFATAEVLLYN